MRKKADIFARVVSEAIYRSDLGVAIVDAVGCVLYANSTMAQLLEANVQEVIGANVSMFVPSCKGVEDVKQTKVQFVQSASNANSSLFAPKKVSLVTVKGNLQPVKMQVTPGFLSDADAKSLDLEDSTPVFVVVVEDLSDVVSAKEELSRLSKAIEVMTG